MRLDVSGLVAPAGNEGLEFPVGVVVTCNGQLVLLVQKRLLPPHFLELQSAQSLQPFPPRVDLHFVVQNILRSELLSHARELSQKLALQSLQNLLQQVGQLLVTVYLTCLEPHIVPLSGDLPRLNERDVGVEFLREFEVDEDGDIFEYPVFFDEFLLNSVLLLFDQLKVQLFRVEFVAVHFFNPGLNTDHSLRKLLVWTVTALQNELSKYATYTYRLFLRFHYFKFLFLNTM